MPSSSDWACRNDVFGHRAVGDQDSADATAHGFYGFARPCPSRTFNGVAVEQHFAQRVHAAYHTEATPCHGHPMKTSRAEDMAATCLRQRPKKTNTPDKVVYPRYCFTCPRAAATQLHNRATKE